MFKDILPGGQGSDPSHLVVLKDTLFFVGGYGTKNGYELWKSDGTDTGTKLFKDILAGSESGLNSQASLTVFKETLLFMANDGTKGGELWKSDGTDTGTKLVKDIWPGTTMDNNLSPPSLVSASGSPYSARASTGEFVVFKDKVFFQANDGATGTELWMSDGTGDGTKLVKDINPANDGSLPANGRPSEFVVFKDTLFFGASDGAAGQEMWKSDGTGDGTKLFKDIRAGPAGSTPAVPFVFKDTLFFTADDGAKGRELWKSDGTGDGTKLVKDIKPGEESGQPAGSSPTEFVVFKDTLFFGAKDAAAGSEMWKSDGTGDGTKLFKDIVPGPDSSYPRQFTVFKDALFFSANDGATGDELWTSDGTSTGTKLVKDIKPGEEFGAPAGSSPAYLKVFKDTLFFSADDGTNGNELWAWIPPTSAPTSTPTAEPTPAPTSAPTSAPSAPITAEAPTSAPSAPITAEASPDEQPASPDQPAANPKCPLTNQFDLPTCSCDNFRNGLTTDHEGKHACERSEVHGLSGAKSTCALPSRPYIHHIDNGCESDTRRCVVCYNKPVSPTCRCDKYAGGASPAGIDGLCQKTGETTCYPRNYAGDKKIGGSEFFGCPEDMFVCVAA